MYLVSDNRDFLVFQVFTAASFTFHVNEEVISLQIHDSIYRLIQIDKISFCYFLAFIYNQFYVGFQIIPTLCSLTPYQSILKCEISMRLYF